MRLLVPPRHLRKLTHTLPGWTHLRRLGLSRSSSVKYPIQSFGSLYNLEELCLDNDNLKGKISASLNGIASLKLKMLEIQFNDLNGEIHDLGFLKNLPCLDASNNAITGEFTASMPDCLVKQQCDKAFIFIVGEQVRWNLELITDLVIKGLIYSMLQNFVWRTNLSLT